MSDPIPEVYLRLGSHSEKQYVMKTARLFEGVIVGANLLESTPGATVSFALGIQRENDKRAFAIDPMTYTFGMDLEFIKSETIDRTSKLKLKKVGLKKSFVALANAYGEPVTSIVLGKNRSLKPSDFTPSLVEAFANSIFGYQMTRMRSHWDSDPQLREIADELPSPSFVFAPYFYEHFGENSSLWKDWHKVNIALAQKFSRIETAVPKHAVICINQTVLSSSQALDEIALGYITSGCAAFWIWFSDFVEQEVSTFQLKNLVALIHKFRDAKVPLFNLHGGYLSALLSKHGMTGFSHAVGYGESKNVIPVIGVIVPTVNYYLPPLHSRVTMLELERALPDLGVHDATEFHEKICDCIVCKGVLKSDLANVHEFGDTILKAGNSKPSQTPDSAKKCRFHFLLARKKEIENVGHCTVADLKRELQEAHAEYSSLPQYLTLRNKAEHLQIWSAGI